MDFITKNLNLFTKYFTKCFIKWILIGIIIFYNNTLLAIGLSEIKVNSYLNEPLSASIKITGAEELDPVSLIADLADAKDFMRAGIPRPFLLSHLKFETKKFNEDLIVYIYSNIVIKDPFLDFLLQLTWPEGTMIKSYSILLDPKPVEKKNVNANLYKQLVTDKKAVVDPSKVNNTDAIFASSLEQPNENELLINNKLNPKKNSKIKNLENSTNIEPNSNHLENLNYLNDNQKDNSNSYSLLNKLINNLQNFSENSRKNKINYQKLLELTPQAISLSKDEEKLAENFAISQVNSELNALRGEKSKKLNPNINNNTDHLNSDNLNSEHLKSDYPNSEPTTNNSNSKHYNVYYSNAHNVELFPAKYGNNLLLAFFLVSATMYLFYKLVSATQATMEVEGNNLQQNEQPNVNLKANSTTFKPANQLAKPITSDITKDNFNNIEIEHNNLENSKLVFLRDEELELKMALANQYIAAGDKKSARELLQEIINVKDQKYKDQITNMLKVVN